MGFVALTKTVKDYNGHFILVYYRPQRSCGKVMFSQASVILFTGEGVYPSMHWGRHPPGQTPPGRHPPGIDTPLAKHPRANNPQAVHAGIHTPCPMHAGIPPSPSGHCIGRYGTHPTGMHSCLGSQQIGSIPNHYTNNQTP